MTKQLDIASTVCMYIHLAFWGLITVGCVHIIAHIANLMTVGYYTDVHMTVIGYHSFWYAVSHTL